MELNIDNFSENIESGKLVLVDFWASWCGPCKVLGPVIDEIAGEYENDDRVIVSKVNVDENQEIAQDYGIRSIPTVVLFKNGEIVDRQVGASAKDTYTQMIEKHI